MSRCFDVTEFSDCVKEEGVYLNHTCITSGSPAWDEVLLANNILSLNWMQGVEEHNPLVRMDNQ